MGTSAPMFRERRRHGERPSVVGLRRLRPDRCEHLLDELVDGGRDAILGKGLARNPSAALELPAGIESTPAAMVSARAASSTSD